MRENHDFTRQIDRNEEGQILVKSTCIYCGISTLGSVIDSSLDGKQFTIVKPNLSKLNGAFGSRSNENSSLRDGRFSWQ